MFKSILKHNYAEMEHIEKQQFIFSVRNISSREQLIVHRFGNSKEAIKLDEF